MATRRPSVPKAQFTAGVGGASGTAGSGTKDPSTTAAPAQGAKPTAGGGSAGAKIPEKRVRKTASGPNSRSRQDGVVHAAGNSPVPARSFSGRLLVLGLTLGVFTLLLAPNVHTFLQQRAEISQLHDDIAASETQLSQYKTELARWDDPAYVKSQARDRVSMLMPGETGYWVYGANGAGGLENSAEEAKAAAAKANTAKNATKLSVEPWVDSLWDSVQKSAQVQTPAPKADAPAAPADAPAPADPPGDPAAPGAEPAPAGPPADPAADSGAPAAEAPAP